MVHRPKKILEICIHDPLAPAVNLLPDLAHGVLRRPPSPIAEVGLIEYRLEDRLQPVEQRLLAYPVVNRGNSQLTKRTRLTRLRDLYLPYRLSSACWHTLSKIVRLPSFRTAPGFPAFGICTCRTG